jgi:hypothetical protein
LAWLRPALLGTVERLIGPGEQPIELVVGLEFGHADAHGDADRPGRAGDRQGLDRRAQSLGHLDRVAVHLGQQHGELLAAAAAEHAGIAHIGLQRPGHGTDHIVADAVPERVVHLLEVVDVDHHGGQRPIVALRDVEQPRRQVGEVPPVEHAGQSVGGGQLLYLGEQPRVGVRGGAWPARAAAISRCTWVNRSAVMDRPGSTPLPCPRVVNGVSQPLAPSRIAASAAGAFSGPPQSGQATASRLGITARQVRNGQRFAEPAVRLDAGRLGTGSSRLQKGHRSVDRTLGHSQLPRRPARREDPLRVVVQATAGEVPGYGVHVP